MCHADGHKIYSYLVLHNYTNPVLVSNIELNWCDRVCLYLGLGKNNKVYTFRVSN